MKTAQEMPTLRIDENHKYFLGDENLLGVSEVLKDNRLIDDRWFDDESRDRGHVVHEILAGVARGLTFDWDFLDTELHGWAKSGIGFLKELEADGAEILGVEEMRYHPLYRVAGTIDLRVLDARGYESIYDFKTGKAPKITRFQIAAYDMLLGPTANGKPRKKAAVEVQQDGSPARIIAYHGPEFYHDANRFLSFLNTTRDRREFAPKES
jgi:hypothetical protein